MMSWFARHRSRRRGAKGKKAEQSPPTQTGAALKGLGDVPLVPVCISTATEFAQRPSAYRPRRQETDATLVDGDLHSDCASESSSSSFFDSDADSDKATLRPRRCPSPVSFDSPPPSPLKGDSPLPNSQDYANPDDPSLWKRLQQQQTISGLQCFGPVPLDCEPSVEVPRSRWSKLASGTTHSISTILKASVVIGEAANLPYLKGIAGIILMISETVQLTEDNQVDCVRLSKMVLEIASVAARHLEEQTDQQQALSFRLENVSGKCTSILQALTASSKLSYARRLIDSANERDLLRQCEKELQHCLNLFQVQSYIATTVALKRRETADDAFEKEVTSVLSNPLVQTISEPEVIEIPETADEPADLAPKPQIFHGRESELAALVEMFSQRQQAHAALIGQAGAGKSALALTLMHQPRIEEKFRHRRFLVDCDGVKSSLELFSRLAAALGLPELPEGSSLSECKKTVTNQLGSAQTPSLVVFDDFDDAWDPPATKLDFEDVITDLSNIPTVSVLLTLRGTQRPLGPAYSKPYPALLGAVTPAAARQAFFDISDVPEDDTDPPLVDVLLHLVGHLPLAVTQLAQLAQYEPLSFLLERYREEGTAMLDGLDDAIEKSLEGARVVECPAALEVLGSLARFPEGVLKAEVAALVGGRLPGAMVNKGLSVLHRTALAVVVPRDGEDAGQERVKVPEVVRTYLERHVLDGGRFRSVEDL